MKRLIAIALCICIASSTQILAWTHGASAIVQPVTGTNFKLVLTLTSAAQAAPQSTKNLWQTAANLLMTTILDTATVNATVGYSASPGGGSPAAAVTSLSSSLQSYTNVRAGYVANAAGPDHAAAVASLPAPPSINGNNTAFVPFAQQKVLGLRSATDPAEDFETDFGTLVPDASTLGVALHEFTHGLGRTSDQLFTWFRFTAAGTYYFVHDPIYAANYFSLDNGTTKIQDMSTSDGGSFENQSYLGQPDPFLTNYFSNTYQGLTPFDIRVINVMGYRVQ